MFAADTAGCAVSSWGACCATEEGELINAFQFQGPRRGHISVDSAGGESAALFLRDFWHDKHRVSHPTNIPHIFAVFELFLSDRARRPPLFLLEDDKIAELAGFFFF